MGDRPLQVAIIGSGIGGTLAALALQRRGVDVQVFEQAPALGEIGAGVSMTPNATRALQRLGLSAQIEAFGAPVGPGSQYWRMDGTPIAPFQTSDSSGTTRVYGMHRADLLNMLSSALDGSVIHTGYRCVDFKQDDEGVRLVFDNGEVARADVAIAANGIQSFLRAEVVTPSAPVHSGSVAYRGLVDSASLPAWPRKATELWMGDGKHFLVYPVRGGSLLNYVGFVPSDQHTSESWSAPGDVAALRAAFDGWDPRIQELLAKVEETYWWGLYDREPLSSWTSGRLTLLGDAAHPMLPHLGQGANQAIEDGVALSVLLAGADRQSAPDALLAYESLRRPRTTEVQLGARANGGRYDSQYDDLDVRDAEVVKSAEFRAWLYDYDVEAEAEALVPAQVAASIREEKQ